MKLVCAMIAGWLASVLVLSLSAFADPPANDDFANTQLISGFPVTVTGSNVQATLEEAEPLPDGYETLAANSVWYQWTAPTSGWVKIDTFGSYYCNNFSESGDCLSPQPWFHPALGVWTGATVSTLTEIRSGGSQQSRFLNVVSGATYRIAVYGLANDFMDQGLIVLNISNDVSSHLSGRVTASDGTTPLQGIIAQASFWNGNWWEQAGWDFTDATGDYTIRGLTGGTYRVGFMDWENRNGTVEYLSEYYDNSEDLFTATDITVPPNSTASNINASLTSAAKLSGTVTGPDGSTPLEDIMVTLFQWNLSASDWDWVAEAATGSSGDYVVGGLHPGQYRVSFEDGNGAYAREFYDNAADLESGTDIAVTSGATVVGIDASLADASGISGTVTGPDAIPIASVVTLYRWNGSGWIQGSDFWTDESGQYSFSALATGVYRVGFAGPDGGDYDFEGEFFNDRTNLASATSIVVSTPTQVTGVDASLAFVRPLLLRMRVRTNAVDVYFTGVEGRAYILQRGDLRGNVWTNVGNPTNCAPGTNVLVGSDSMTTGVWRVRRY